MTQNQFNFKQFLLAYVRSLNCKIVLFQTYQFSISTQFISILLINRTLSGATTPGQSGLGGEGSEEEYCITKSSSIIGTS